MQSYGIGVILSSLTKWGGEEEKRGFKYPSNLPKGQTTKWQR